MNNFFTIFLPTRRDGNVKLHIAQRNQTID